MVAASARSPSSSFLGVPPASSAARIENGLLPASARPAGPQRPVDVTRAPWAAEYPFASHWLDVSDGVGSPLWLHFVDEGPRDAPVLLFLHGNPTWSFYWRKLIVALRDRFRCIAPDHIGMGLSDRPQAWSYRLEDHIGNVEKLLAALGVQRFVTIGHDWGGCIAAGVATERPDDVDAAVFMNTAAFRSEEIPASIAACRIPVFGSLAVLHFNAFAGVAAIRAPHKRERMTSAVRHGYLDPYATPHDRIATLRFVEDIPLRDTHPSWARLSRIEERLPLLRDKPVALFWGDADFCFTPRFRARFQREFPNADVHAWPDCGHYVVEDAHERILPLLTPMLVRSTTRRT